MAVGKAALNQFIQMDINKVNMRDYIGAKCLLLGSIRTQMDGCYRGFYNLDWIVDPVQVQRLCLMIDHIAAGMTKMG